MRRWFTAPVLALVFVALVPQAALAKSYLLPEARIEVKVRPDGAVRVTEFLTYDFSGDFTGGYREIPLREGERIDGISVSEPGGRPYAPGASAEIGSSGAPGTFGVADLGDAVRIVWHYSASFERRTFVVNYTMNGLAVAHDDVVDVNLRVWGDEWTVPLSQLKADMALPGKAPGDVRVWGHPGSVDGVTALKGDGSGATLAAGNVQPGHWVEMRVVFPRSLLESTLGAKVVPGDGLEDILAEERAFADAAQRDRARWEYVKRNWPWLLLLLLISMTLPAAVVGYFVWTRHGREPQAPFVGDHIMEPPGEEAPALVTALLEPGHQRATGEAFTATLFDLIRRKHLDAIPTTTIKRTWMGLREEDISDLAIRAGANAKDSLTPFEGEVMSAVQKAQGSKERLLLSTMRDEIKGEPTYFHNRFQGFKSDVGKAVKAKGWWITEGLKPLLVAIGIFFLLALVCIALAKFTYDPVDIVPWSTIFWGIVAGVCFANAAVLGGMALVRRGWERRSQEGAELASRWGAFRRFLTDFAGMKEAVPGSIEIWERYLVYGIAFGVADRVLAGAQLHAPPELDTTSNVYWISQGGAPGHGPSLFAISDLSSAIASASPPSSSAGEAASPAAEAEAEAEAAPGSRRALPAGRAGRSLLPGMPDTCRTASGRSEG